MHESIRSSIPMSIVLSIDFKTVSIPTQYASAKIIPTKGPYPAGSFRDVIMITVCRSYEILFLRITLFGRKYKSRFQKSFWLCPLPFSASLQIHTEDVINITRYGEERRKNMRKIMRNSGFCNAQNILLQKCYPQKTSYKFENILYVNTN